jgi:hypothetical protein
MSERYSRRFFASELVQKTMVLKPRQRALKTWPQKRRRKLG